MIPRAARDQYAAQANLTDVVTASAKRLWRRMKGRRWETAWRDDVGPQVTEVVREGQAASAAQSALYVQQLMAELDLKVTASTRLVPNAFSGVTGNGSPVESLTYGAVVTAAKAQYRPELASLPLQMKLDAALAEAERELEQAVASIMADTARAAETTAIAQRPWLTGYIRMIEPGACSRCAVLAGRYYLRNEGFLRHPRCRCVHIPYAEDAPDDPRTSPSAYFDSLSTAEQDRIFTNAGAEAVRLGADVSQVVNARRGMSTAQQNPRGWIPKGRLVPVDVLGRPTYVTDEGVTRRGAARKSMGSKRPVRLMPESILQIAKSRDDAIRLLRLYGYIETP